MAVNFPADGILRAAFDRLLPRRCAACGEVAAAAWCDACHNDLPRLAGGELCPGCASPLPAAASGLCGACQRQHPPWDVLWVPFRYAWPLRGLIATMKFGRRIALTAALGELLEQELPPLHADSVLPVPMHPRRLAQRGFNQAAELAAQIARRRRLPWTCGALLRLRHTPPQSGLPARLRHANARATFVATDAVAGATLLLVDDVLTTGNTLAAAAAACRDAGAVRIVVAVLARA